MIGRCSNFLSVRATCLIRDKPMHATIKLPIEINV